MSYKTFPCFIRHSFGDVCKLFMFSWQGLNEQCFTPSPILSGLRLEEDKVKIRGFLKLEMIFHYNSNEIRCISICASKKWVSVVQFLQPVYLWKDFFLCLLNFLISSVDASSHNFSYYAKPVLPRLCTLILFNFILIHLLLSRSYIWI